MTALVSLRAVAKSFGENRVLDGVDLDVQASEVVCLVGPSGSGKSTLLRCVNFLERYDDGEIRVGGVLVGWRDAPGPRRLAPARHCANCGAASAWCSSSSTCGRTSPPRENIAEALVQVRGLLARDAAPRGRKNCWRAWGWRKRPTPTLPACPAASSSAWPSPGASRWSRG